MRVWLIKISEVLPTDGDNIRLLRMGMLANALINNGHQVLWWASTFDHVKKIHKFPKDTLLNVSNHFSIYFLRSMGYKKNISIDRFMNHYAIARKFKALSEFQEKPDIIISSLPTLELCVAATEYGIKHKIPVLLDIRDLWPDIFLDFFPKWARKLMKIAFRPLYKMAENACRHASGIMGNTPSFIDWGLELAQREANIFDKYFPFGYTSNTPSEKELTEARNFWNKHSIHQENKDFIVCFFGNMGHYFDLKTIIEVAKKIEKMNKRIKFVLCGSGDNFCEYKQLAKNCKNVVLPGRVDAAQIWVLMRISSIGLAPYKSDSLGFVGNLPNKPIEYFSSGLPVLSSLQGYLQTLLETKHCGVTYNNEEILLLKLIELYDNPSVLKTMSDNAYRLYLEEFVGEVVYKNMVKHISMVAHLYKEARLEKKVDFFKGNL